MKDDRKKIIVDLLDHKFSNFSEYSFTLPDKYWKKYVKMLEKKKIDSDYIDSHINLEDSGEYFVYHSFSVIYKDEGTGAYVNMKMNTVTEFDEIQIVNLNGEILEKIKHKAY